VLDADGSVVEEAILEATGRSHRVSVLSFDDNVDYRSRL
jgi:hypothetical protein